MCSNFTYFAITSLIRSHILEFGSDKNTCSPFNLRFTSCARSCSLACCYDYLFIKHSSPALLLQIQPWITGDPVVTCVFPEVSWCLGKTRSCEKKYLENFKDNVVFHFDILQKKITNILVIR